MLLLFTNVPTISFLFKIVNYFKNEIIYFSYTKIIKYLILLKIL
jgi:hypothetical protein